jgi:hypothetical protein
LRRNAAFTMSKKRPYVRLRKKKKCNSSMNMPIKSNWRWMSFISYCEVVMKQKAF